MPLMQPPAYRFWDPKYRSFFYTDVPGEATDLRDHWSGFFDRQGTPIYGNDILRVHYNWKYGWVRATVKRDAQGLEFRAEARAADGAVLSIGRYCFADAYCVGNTREHPGKLAAAQEQFAKRQTVPRCMCGPVFSPNAGISCN